jgi:methionyl-tRNA formyltransferase
MKIVFIGAVDFSHAALTHLLKLGAEVVGVCTLKNSKTNNDHVDLSQLSDSHGIPWTYAENIKPAENVEWIIKKSPDVIFCFGWSKLIKAEILDCAPLGVIGFHPAGLPSNRGRHPIIWALVLGLEKTASFFFFMDRGADTGDILAQQSIMISEEDDAASLYEKVTKVALKQIESFLPLLENFDCHRQSQNPLLATSWRKRGLSDGRIDWRMSANSIHNLVRGLAKPYVGASFIIDEQEIRVWKTEMVQKVPSNIEPGKVVSVTNEKLIVKCGENAICLIETEPMFSASPGTYL